MAESDTLLTASPDDALKLFTSALKDVEKAKNSSHDKGEETVSRFGFEMPKTGAVLIDGLSNKISDLFTAWIQKGTFKKAELLAEKLPLKSSAQVRAVAAGTTIAVNTVFQSLFYVGPVKKALRERHESKRYFQKKIAPELAELKKVSKGIKDNEVLDYANQRLSEITKVPVKSSIIRLLVNVLPNVAVKFSSYHQLWHEGLPSKQIVTAKQKPELTEKAELKLEDWMKPITQFGSAIIADPMEASATKALKQKFATSYTALKMINDLAAQVERDPKLSTYQLPGKHAGAPSLENYLQQIFEMHQKNMAEISANHVEIRSALTEDLKTLVKPIAKAIREGDLDTRTLIDWVGTGKIIKNQGRALASVSEVEALIEKQAAKPVTLHTDLKEFYKDQAFNRDDLQKFLDAADDKEKDFLFSILPEEILHDLGYKEDEIKKRHDAAAKLFASAEDPKGARAQIIGSAIAGIHTQPKEAREKVAKSDQREIDHAYDEIQSKGVEAAIHDLKTSPANAHGIEETILNVAVPNGLADREYMGKLLEHGQSKLAEMTSESKSAKATRPARSDHKTEFEDETDFNEKSFVKRTSHDEDSLSHHKRH